MKRNIILLLACCLLLNACVKERQTVDFKDNTTRPLVEFTTGGADNLNQLAVNLAPGITEVTLTELRFVTRSVVTQNSTVTIELNPSLIEAYNTNQQTNYEVPPAGAFSFSNNVYTLSPTARTVDVKISIDANAISVGEYALGFTITQVTGAGIGLKKDFIVSLKAKNIYDGDYTSNGYVYHPSVPRAIVDLPKTLTTLTSTSVSCELGDLGGSGYIAIFDVDASNNVTITAFPGAPGAPYTMFTTGLPAASPGYTAQWPGSTLCNNVYDPVAQEFRVRYGYFNAGAGGWRVTEEIIKRNP